MKGGEICFFCEMALPYGDSLAGVAGILAEYAGRNPKRYDLAESGRDLSEYSGNGRRCLFPIYRQVGGNILSAS